MRPAGICVLFTGWNWPVRIGGRPRDRLFAGLARDAAALPLPARALRPPYWPLHADSVDLTGKLQIKPGQSVAVVNPPPGLALPGVLAAPAAADADAVIAFVARQDDLDSAEQAVAAARADRLAWISYPKGGRLGTDLNRDRLAAALAMHGVQPVRQVSIDDTWSALRFRPADK